MGKKEISITIRAKNAMAAGIARAGAALKSFGQSALRIGKAFAASFAAAGAAIGAFAAKALSAYAEQEKAERSLTAALNAYGETGAGIVPSLKEMAAAIQDETGAADESTLAGMARLKMLGVQTSKLGEAAKATIALKGLGLEEAAAQKAVAMAMQGSYEMLNRYVPALRTATSDTEKAQIVNDLFARGYEQQKDLLNTTGGAWAALRGRVGDAWEAVGKVIEQNTGLTEILQKVGDKVKELTQRFSDWAANGGMVDVVAGIKVFAAEAIYRFKSVGLGFKLIWSVAKDATMTGVNYITNFVKAFADQTIESFKLVGAWAAAAWEKIKSPTSEFKAPDTTSYDAAVEKMADAMVGKDALVTESSKATMQEIESLTISHMNKMEELEKKAVAAKEEFLRKKAEAEKKQVEAERLAAERAEKEKQEVAKKSAAAAKEEAEKKKKAMDEAANAAKDAAGVEIDQLEKVQDAEEAAVKRGNLTLQQRARMRMAGIAVGQLDSRAQERTLAMHEGTLGLTVAARKKLRGAAGVASDFQTTKEKREAEAVRSAADKSIGTNVQKIADTLEESLKPA